VAEAPYRSPDGSGDLIQPGNIPANIIMKYIAHSGLTSFHIVTVRGKKKHGYASRIGSMHEFGTYKMQATPFMRPAVDEGRSEVAQAMHAELQRGIEASARGAKGKA
jgi:HK97 gp10 family phage protein